MILFSNTCKILRNQSDARYDNKLFINSLRTEIAILRSYLVVTDLNNNQSYCLEVYAVVGSGVDSGEWEVLKLMRCFRIQIERNALITEFSPFLPGERKKWD